MGRPAKREQVSSTGRYQPTIGKKRPSGGVNEPADKKPKELGKQIVVMTGERLELLRRRRKARNPELHPLHPLLHPERRLVLDLHKGSDEEPEESDGVGQE
ncbi:hypothetical protein Taro_002880 [Colocasia esculenta]|uniref:Uncharacterized protein n=1 Tax=Colocasia esculenta TaxID=4460 RepID=A0A843TQ53_COLES|nr:hypothetical protein [Colocasia esculenta]